MNTINIDSILNQVAIEAVQRLISSESSSNPRSDDRIMLSSTSAEEQKHHQQVVVSPPPEETYVAREVLNDQQGSLLSSGFRPSDRCVIVGRGKEAKMNPGNKKLRTMIASTFLDQYAHATNDKQTKSKIVSDIVAIVDNACHGEGFIKRDISGKWYKVDNAVAREKVGCLLRDMLAHKYRSSSKYKVALRQKKRYSPSTNATRGRCRNSSISSLEASLFDIMPLPFSAGDTLQSGRQPAGHFDDRCGSFTASNICFQL